MLAPEGVAQTAVDYYAFLAPLALWLGLALLAERLLDAAVDIGGAAYLCRLAVYWPEVGGTRCRGACRQRMRLGRNVVLLLIAISFAMSTAVFDTTYNAQSLVDAQLTNGADVSVTRGIRYPDLAARLAALPGVAAAPAHAASLRLCGQ